MRYSDRKKVIDLAIAPSLDDASQYDMEAISHEAFTFKTDVNEQGQELLNTAGFEQTVSDEEYWEIVAKHALSDPCAEGTCRSPEAHAEGGHDW